MSEHLLINPNMKLFPSSLFLATVFIVVSQPVGAIAPNLQSDDELVVAGYYRLSWQSSAKGDFILEEATDPTFSPVTTLYRGPDTATVISGRSDGIYFYRIRNAQDEEKNAWSKVAKVEVAHHPLSRAFIFFVLGAIVFIATLVIVVHGNKTYK